MAQEREYYGSLLMVSPPETPAGRELPRDEHGFPYQVILLLHPGGQGTKGLKCDDEGRVLGWEMTAEGQPGPGMRPVPAAVAEAALEWWREYQRDPKRFR
ncbi:MAG: hypothetical protein ACRD0O_00075 [Acidimicrobiia bacterium]